MNLGKQEFTINQEGDFLRALNNFLNDDLAEAMQGVASATLEIAVGDPSAQRSDTLSYYDIKTLCETFLTPTVNARINHRPMKRLLMRVQTPKWTLTAQWNYDQGSLEITENA